MTVHVEQAPKPEASRLSPVAGHAAAWRALLLLTVFLLVPGCDDEPLTTPVTTATLTGTVVSSATGQPVAGALVDFGVAVATTDADGRYRLIGFGFSGQRTLACMADGFEEYTETVTVEPGTVTHDITLTPVDPSIPLLVRGELRPELQQVFLFRAGKANNHAAVTVNGSPISHSRDGRPGSDVGVLPRVAQPGTGLLLGVSVDGTSIQAFGDVPAMPLVTAPAVDSLYAWTDTVTVAWSAETDPDGFVVTFLESDWWGEGRYPVELSVPGSARELKVVAGDLGELCYGSVSVTAFDVASFTGPSDPGSRVTILSWDGFAPGGIAIRCH